MDYTPAGQGDLPARWPAHVAGMPRKAHQAQRNIVIWAAWWYFPQDSGHIERNIKPALQNLKRVLLAPFIWLGAAIFLIEEFIWEWTAAMMAKLGAVRLVHAVERRIAALRPRWAFVAFILPSAILVPAKLIGLHAIAAGHWVIGSAVFIVAKVAGVALFSRIFNLTRPALMQLAWFARFYAWVMLYRNRIHAYLGRWEAYQSVKRRIVSMVDAIKTSLRSPAGKAQSDRRD